MAYNMSYFRMGFLLYIISLLLGLMITPALIVLNVLFYILTLNFKGLDNYFFRMAVSKDQQGGTSGNKVFDFLLLKKHSKHKFGNPDETISSVLGKNQQLGTLAFLGRGLNNILQWLDKNHSVKSIEQ